LDLFVIITMRQSLLFFILLFFLIIRDRSSETLSIRRVPSRTNTELRGNSNATYASNNSCFLPFERILLTKNNNDENAATSNRALVLLREMENEYETEKK